MTASWTNGDGSKRIVKINTTNSFTDPVDGTDPTANSIYGGSGEQVVFNGSGSSVNVTGLLSGTTYFFRVYEANCSGSSVKFLIITATNNPNSQATTTPTTYTWTGAVSTDWTVAGNWSPSRTTPATDDILKFTGGGSFTVTNVPTQTIGELTVINSTTVLLEAGATGTTLTVAGGAGTDLPIGTGSTLNIDTANTLTIDLSTGATGSIGGSMTFSGAAHKLTAVDANAITFQSGSSFTTGTGFSSNAFGTTNLGSIIFASGSTYIQNAGSNPFGASAPNSVIVFQSGSLYKQQSSGTPSFDGRTYANFEYNLAAPATSGGGSGTVTFNNFTVTAGTFNLSTTGTANINGSVSIASGATLALTGATALTFNVGGNWSDSGTFTPNSRAVTFNGAGTQTVARGAAGIETFAYLIVDKASGNLTFSNAPATSVIVTSPVGGTAMQIINAGGIDLGNGNGLALSGAVAGTNMLAGGAAVPATRIITGAGTFAFTGGAKSVTNNNGKTLTFDTGVNVTLNQPVDFGANLTTVNGTLTIGSNGGAVVNNAPTYGNASTLLYDCACVFHRSTEWSASSGAGYPANVQVNNISGTDLDLGSTTPGTARQMAGNLLIKSGGNLLMDFVGAGGSPMTAPLTVLGGVNVQSGIPVQNNGSLHLSTLNGGDLNVGGNFQIDGTFTANSRTVNFNGTGATQTISGASAISFADFKTSGAASVTSTVNFNVTRDWTNDAAYNGGSEVVNFNGTSGAQTIGGATPTNFASVNLNNSAGVSLSSNQTVRNNLALTASDLTTGASVLTQPNTGASSGNFDVVGNVTRTGFESGGAALSFGNPNVTIKFNTGTAATSINVNLVKSRPTGNGFGFTNAVNRTYTITPTGGSNFTATLRLHYLDSELSGTPVVGEEGLLDLWRFNGTSWQRFIKSNADPITGNWIENNNVTSFSPWTLSATPLAPTAARLRDFHATKYGTAGTVIEWNTQTEVDNLGFNVYREDGGGTAARVPVNSSLIAGSALAVGTRTVLGAGNGYSWVDRAGTSFSRYWLEAIDTNGVSTMSGPYTPAPAGRGQKMPPPHQALLLSQLGTDATPADAVHQWWAHATTTTNAAPVTIGDRFTSKSARALRNGRRPLPVVPVSPADAQQRALAAGAAVKLAVRHAGWYRVTRAQLEAAGLNPAVDPARLQLFAEGVELPLRVNNAGAWQQNGSVEFYGEGFDQTATDTRVYWLVEGQTAGRRLGSTRAAQEQPADGNSSVNTPPDGGSGGATSDGSSITPGGDADPDAGVPKNYDYTVERRDRTIYYSSLTNGETENFFGRVVSSTPGTQTLNVRHLEQTENNQGQLEVSLQGVTAGAHTVHVVFNGTEVGTLEFAGREHKAAKFLVESWMMQEGDNLVQLTSSVSGDVSLTDYLRLTYQHLNRADDDALRFVANGSANVRVTGFTSDNVRVMDITDPQNVSEVPVVVTESNEKGDGWMVTVQPSDTSPARTLYAFADRRVEEVAGLSANQPSDWHAAHEADFVIITHDSFRQAVAPLAAKREAEGLKTTVVDVEDLYDEFSYGEHSPQAIKDFLLWTTENWTTAPRYVLLAGDGSYDPRNYMKRGVFDLVPSKLIDTLLMETASDNWYADFDDDGLAEMSVGRLPVRTVEEATLVVGKIVNHEPDTTGAQSSALLVADRDGADGYSFESATDTVQNLLPGAYNVARINRSTQSADAVRSQIVGAVNGGPAIVNWMGHGSVNVWTGDGLLRGEDAATLQNGARLPLFVMMTCLNGYYQDPSLESLSESLLKASQGGALAVWSSSGMTEPEGQVAMNRELYRILFTGTGALRLGDAMQQAKTATTDMDVRRTWVLIGDPTTRWR